MKVSSTGIQNGIIDDKFGKFGSSFIDDMPTFSLPFQIEDEPEKTVSFAVILDDKDAIPVCGFDWIHWLVCNLKKNHLVAGVSTQKVGSVAKG